MDARDVALAVAFKNDPLFFGGEIHPAKKQGTMGNPSEAPARTSRLPHEGNAPTPSSVLRFITCGSVDDGKSTLIGRLLHDTRQILEDQLSAVALASKKRGFDGADLSLLTDGLEAEREQGITIDVAYRYFATPRRKFIIADTPGHVQYTRNMATGASTAHAAVILADATKGLLPQGKRHLYIAHLLGIRDIVVAVNKMDLAGCEERAFDAVRAAFGAFAAPMRIPNLQFVPVSALEGDMVVERGERMPWYRGPTLLELLEGLEPAKAATGRPLRFAVQLVQRTGGERRYLGRLASGSARPGQEIVVLPAGRPSRIKAIHAHEGLRKFARAGDSVALTLADDLDISRGDLIAAAAAAPSPASALQATLVWLAAAPLEARGKYLLKHTTRTVRAKLAAVNYVMDVDALEPRFERSALAMNDIGHVSLELAQPVFADPYTEDRATGAFILIDAHSHQTVAAGMVG
jgi:sulfate adenylyltransferase subunit 1